MAYLLFNDYIYADFSLSIPSILHLISLDSFHIRIWQEGSLYAKSYNVVNIVRSAFCPCSADFRDTYSQEEASEADSYRNTKHLQGLYSTLLQCINILLLIHAPYRDYEGPTAMPWSQWILIRDLRIEISFSLVHLEGPFPLRSGFIKGQMHETRILFYFSASKAVKSTGTPETSPLHCRVSWFITRFIEMVISYSGMTMLYISPVGYWLII